MLKVGVTPEVNAVSTLLLAGTVVLIVLAHRLLEKGQS
jgi:ABC-type spermidine/putrescine transport system permease subunit II